MINIDTSQFTSFNPEKLVSIPYVWRGNSLRGMDCFSYSIWIHNFFTGKSYKPYDSYYQGIGQIEHGFQVIRNRLIKELGNPTNRLEHLSLAITGSENKENLVTVLVYSEDNGLKKEIYLTHMTKNGSVVKKANNTKAIYRFLRGYWTITDNYCQPLRLTKFHQEDKDGSTP